MTNPSSSQGIARALRKNLTLSNVYVGFDGHIRGHGQFGHKLMSKLVSESENFSEKMKIFKDRQCI